MADLDPGPIVDVSVRARRCVSAWTAPSPLGRRLNDRQYTASMSDGSRTGSTAAPRARSIRARPRRDRIGPRHRRREKRLPDEPQPRRARRRPGEHRRPRRPERSPSPDPRIVAGRGRHHQGRIHHRAGENAHVIERPGERHHAPAAHPAIGLEADDATGGRGRCTGPTSEIRAPRGPSEPPPPAAEPDDEPPGARTPCQGSASPRVAERELRRLELPQDHGSHAPEARHARRVLARRRVGKARDARGRPVSPAASMMSLSPIGTPSRGPWKRPSRASASSRRAAPSGSLAVDRHPGLNIGSRTRRCGGSLDGPVAEAGRTMSRGRVQDGQLEGRLIPRILDEEAARCPPAPPPRRPAPARRAPRCRGEVRGALSRTARGLGRRHEPHRFRPSSRIHPPPREIDRRRLPRYHPASSVKPGSRALVHLDVIG